MLFVEFRFLCFFLVVFCVHWMLRGNRSRKLWLLLSSYFFYSCFFIGNPVSFYEKVRLQQALPVGWWFPFVLMASTAMDFAIGLGIADASSERRRKLFLLCGLLVNLGVLCLFKYYDFFLDSASSFLRWFGLQSSDWTLNLFLPYGISFYTFQSMSYSIDVYRRRIQPVRNFLDLAFFISFFPQLVAGPIVRASTFLPQVFVRRVWATVDLRGCLVLFLSGFIKKACISESVAPIADEFFRAPGEFNLYSSFIGVLFYAVQIYCDFSGYTEMALATARLLGYELTLNFNFPYFAQNVSEFWRRWHISLSTWLRDYLYISLGGNRGTSFFTQRNLMLTMVLGGLWHGASWNFVIWGALHGTALIVHRQWQQATLGSGTWLQNLMRWIGPVLCFYWICITWVFFRAQPVAEPQGLSMSGFEVAAKILDSLILFRSHGSRSFSSTCLGFFLALATLHFLVSRGVFSTWWRKIPAWIFAALLGATSAGALLFVPAKYKAFIYFQF